MQQCHKPCLSPCFCFSGEKPFKEEKPEIAARLERIFDEMARKYGA